jgi:hypothetical protein
VNKSRQRAGRRGGSGARSVGSKGMRSTSCVSSRGSPPATPENSSSEEEEEEESDGGPAERWNPPPSSPRAIEAAEEQAPAVERSMEEPAHATEALASAAGASASAAAAMTGAVVVPLKPSRKRKRGFSNLR